MFYRGVLRQEIKDVNMDNPTCVKLILLTSFLVFLKIIKLSQNIAIVQGALVSSGESQTQTGLHS